MDIKAMTLPRMTAFQFSGSVGGKMSVGYGGSLTVRAVAVRTKREICTADELHYVAVPKSDWKLALWRYLPPPQAQLRNHPLLLLSGVATNAIGYDLSPEASFARYMSSKGFDTWILEVRGAGLSAYGLDPMEDSFDSSEVATASDESPSKVSDGIGILFDRFSDLFGEERFRYLSQRLIQTVEEESQRLVDFQEHLSSTLKVFLEQIQSTVNYDWDFDHYLEDDIPAAFEYIRTESKPKDGKLLAIGHSMGGILLYALLSSSCSQGKEHGLKSVVTLASSLDYTSSRSSLKLLLPVADPVKALNVPAIPVGAMIAAAHPFASYPPYILSWLRSQISSPGMLHPKLLRRLVTCNFCTIPSKLLLQLSTVFQEGGLRDRKGNFVYKHHMHQSNVPILAVAGDQDLICPPEAVYETVKVIPKDLVSYRVFGEIRGPHFAHYDLVGGLWAVNQVYPCIVEFLSQHDR